MGNTIYASFNDASLAEKAAGALLDNGVKAEDLSLVRNQPTDTYAGDNGTWSAGSEVGMTPSTSGQDYTNKQLDTDLNPQGNAYTSTGNTGTWTGTSANNENEGVSYTGSVYGTDMAGTGSPTAFSASDTPAENVYDANNGYGDTSYRESDLNTDSYKRDKSDKTPGDYEKAAKEGISTTTGADAGAGAIKGAGWGLGVGILAGIASLIIPGVGLVLGGGALATAIGGAAATTGAGAIAGGVTGYLKDQGMDEEVATDYDKVVKNGGAMIAVTLPSGNVDEMTAREILNKYGAANVSQYASKGYMA
jgi:hypothetical protein